MSVKNSAPTITDKTEQLRQLVAWFDSDEFVLEEAIARFEKAQALAADIEADLTTLKNDITIVKQRFDEEL